ncbi:unnamed protein product [Adineta ricciae]|uniref:Uncharacterized protein n=1 Tax=Adineta ricciae TaxID=249248 RepID=A0A815R641_ADIRI|nr:unnamed protein product [Adineta ricciae]
MATNNGCSSEQFVIPVNQSSTPFVLKVLITNIFQIAGLFVEIQLIMFIEIKHNSIIELKWPSLRSAITPVERPHSHTSNTEPMHIDNSHTHAAVAHPR